MWISLTLISDVVNPYLGYNFLYDTCDVPHRKTTIPILNLTTGHYGNLLFEVHRVLYFPEVVLNKVKNHSNSIHTLTKQFTYENMDAMLVKEIQKICFF